MATVGAWSVCGLGIQAGVSWRKAAWRAWDIEDPGTHQPFSLRGNEDGTRDHKLASYHFHLVLWKGRPEIKQSIHVKAVYLLQRSRQFTEEECIYLYSLNNCINALFPYWVKPYEIPIFDCYWSMKMVMPRGLTDSSTNSPTELSHTQDLGFHSEPSRVLWIGALHQERGGTWNPQRMGYHHLPWTT